MIELNIDESDLETHVARAANASGFAYAISLDRDKSVLTLEMPKADLKKHLDLPIDEPGFKIDVTYLSAEKSAAAGLENRRHVILRNTGNGVGVTKRGEQRVNFRIGTYAIPTDEIPAAKNSLARDMEGELTQIAGKPALLFPLPVFAS